MAWKDVYVLGLLAAFSAAGCGADAADAGDSVARDVGEAKQAVTAGFFTSWSQGSPTVSLGPTSDRFCYLTHIQGNFEGTGESVKVFTSLGNWFLGGTSQQQGVGASVACVPLAFWDRVSTFTDEFSWSQGASSVPMAPDDGRNTCLITRMTGKFEGTGESIQVTRANGFWWLGGTSQQSGVGGGARCLVAAPQNEGTVEYSYSDGVHYTNGPVNLAQINGISCGLTMVTGKFKGTQEWLDLSQVNGRWTLAANSLQTWVRGTAECFF